MVFSKGCPRDDLLKSDSNAGQLLCFALLVEITVVFASAVHTPFGRGGRPLPLLTLGWAFATIRARFSQLSRDKPRPLHVCRAAPAAIHSALEKILGWLAEPGPARAWGGT